MADITNAMIITTESAECCNPEDAQAGSVTCDEPDQVQAVKPNDDAPAVSPADSGSASDGHSVPNSVSSTQIQKCKAVNLVNSMRLLATSAHLGKLPLNEKKRGKIDRLSKKISSAFERQSQQFEKAKAELKQMKERLRKSISISEFSMPNSSSPPAVSKRSDSEEKRIFSQHDVLTELLQLQRMQASDFCRLKDTVRGLAKSTKEVHAKVLRAGPSTRAEPQRVSHQALLTLDKLELLCQKSEQTAATTLKSMDDMVKRIQSVEHQLLSIRSCQKSMPEWVNADQVADIVQQVLHAISKPLGHTAQASAVIKHAATIHTTKDSIVHHETVSSPAGEWGHIPLICEDVSDPVGNILPAACPEPPVQLPQSQLPDMSEDAQEVLVIDEIAASPIDDEAPLSATGIPDQLAAQKFCKRQF